MPRYKLLDPVAEVLGRLERIATALAEPDPKPSPKPKRTRKPVAPTPLLQPPPGTSVAEWQVALENVRAGSAPSTIAKGSDIPSDFTLRRNGLAP
jgi:hypothetical protein